MYFQNYTLIIFNLTNLKLIINYKIKGYVHLAMFKKYNYKKLNAGTFIIIYEACTYRYIHIKLNMNAFCLKTWPDIMFTNKTSIIW